MIASVSQASRYNMRRLSRPILEYALQTSKVDKYFTQVYVLWGRKSGFSRMFYEFLFSTESVSLFPDSQTSYKGFNPRLGNVRMRDNASFLHIAYEQKCLQSYFLPSDKVFLQIDKWLSLKAYIIIAEITQRRKNISLQNSQ